MVNGKLWFDVENKRYTTNKAKKRTSQSCGLM